MRNGMSSPRINDVEATSDILTSRGGLALFSRYLENIGIFELLIDTFGYIRKTSKGRPVWMLFKQVFCFLFDGTSRHLTYLDDLKKDDGYAATIETDPKNMASSHTIKRFFSVFGWLCGRPFRSILRQLFIWRLKLEMPDEIEFTIDTMVMDNDEAKKREAVNPTYKNVKGFQPLQIIWKGKIVDGIFRGGNKNGNHGETVIRMVKELVNLIRRKYREDVTIIIRCDAGFFDQKNYKAFDELGIGFIASGKMYESVKEFVQNTNQSFWDEYSNGHQVWGFTEFGFRCDNWESFYRAIYTCPLYEEQQMLLDFARPENVILTNIGINDDVLQHCSEERKKYWLDPKVIIESHHQRGADELPHRGFKDFGFEELPFKRFGPNTAFYYCMLIAFFLSETFKEDVLMDVIPITSYATTVRRKVIDIAGKIINTGRRIILKVSHTTMDFLKFDRLWENCQNPPPILS